ncbi:hypothetical protein DPMN_084830 [Dreissena polymorpha]|uniref:Uncharacterized protein n=1 Tax=Dreissena polymorpha TaxID=45954 RepID=A0A9D3YCH7_DREPO|nr:hypothetical protein DPMN_084830 [Dreissena polymorpha]
MRQRPTTFIARQISTSFERDTEPKYTADTTALKQKTRQTIHHLHILKMRRIE